MKTSQKKPHENYIIFLNKDVELTSFDREYALYEITKFLFNFYNDNLNSLLEATKGHIPVLTEKYRRLVYKDEFGDVIHDKWSSYYSDYINNKLISLANSAISFDKLPHVLIEEFPAHKLEFDFTSIANNYRNQIINDASEKILNCVTRNNHPTTFELEYINRMTGEEYEYYCGSQLEESGWNVHYTPTRGDRGVDILATKGDLNIAIQCKRSSSPVGNKAVQEIFSGAKICSANYAVVITNNTFTRQAQHDALELNVTLIQNSEISLIENKIDTGRLDKEIYISSDR